MDFINNKTDNSVGTSQLEPRVAKLELGMERLTEDVRDLAQVVRTQGSQMEQDIQKLIVAVTQASGPRKTDWSTIIAGIMLIFAIGSAVFWPLNKALQDTQTQLNIVTSRIDDHQKLDMHPVGDAIAKRLELQLTEHIKSDEVKLSNHLSDAREMHRVITESFQKDLSYQKQLFDNQLKFMQVKYDTWMEKITGCVEKLQDRNLQIEQENRNELNRWRQKAMKLDSNTN